MGRGQEFCDWNQFWLSWVLRLDTETDFGFCDWHLVLGWVGLEIDGLGRSTESMTSNFYLFLS